MKHFASKLVVGLCAGALSAALSAGPALASASPAPRVQIGDLSGPTPGFEGAMEYWLDVTASDRDGVISEITVEWTGEDYHSILYAHRSCMVIPGAPGEPLTMRLPVSLPGPGSYRARVHAHSIASCDEPGEEQSGPSKQHRFRIEG